MKYVFLLCSVGSTLLACFLIVNTGTIAFICFCCGLNAVFYLNKCIATDIAELEKQKKEVEDDSAGAD